MASVDSPQGQDQDVPARRAGVDQDVPAQRAGVDQDVPAQRAGVDQNDHAHRAGVIKVALSVAGGSAVGLTGIIGAAAYSAIPAGLAYAAIAAFSLIMVSALAVVLSYIRR